MAELNAALQIRHLLRRAGFASSRSSIAAAEGIYTAAPGTHLQKYEALVDALLNYSHDPLDANGWSAGSETGTPALGIGLKNYQVDNRLAQFGSPTLSSLPDADAAVPVGDLLHPPKNTIPSRAVQTFGSTDALRQWWVSRMVYSDRPLLEKMTLFWHNHLTSNAGTVGDANLMAMQNKFFRDNALGSFLHLLRAITRDPAMQIYLDNDSNVETRMARDGVTWWEGSNENYGRELLELYGLGVDSGYTEDDVKAAARALTGWGLRNHPTTGVREFYFQFNQHVSRRTTAPTALTGTTSSGIAGNAPYAFLGASAVWGQITTTANSTAVEALPFLPTTSFVNPANDVHQRVVDWVGYTGDGRPKAAYFMAFKLWKFFGGPAGVPADVPVGVRDRMVAAYLGQHNPGGGIWASANDGSYGPGNLYGIKGMLKTLFMSDDFRSTDAYRALVKSPTELVVGVLRTLQAVSTISAQAVATPTVTSGNLTGTNSLRTMDHDLLNPAFPSGWDGFEAWMNSTTFMSRANFINGVVTSRTPPGSWDLANTDSNYLNLNAYCAGYGLSSWASYIDHILDTCIDVTPGLAPGDANTPGSHAWWVARLTAYVNGVIWNVATPDSTATVTVNGQLTSPSIKLRGILYLVFSSPEYQLA